MGIKIGDNNKILKSKIIDSKNESESGNKLFWMFFVPLAVTILGGLVVALIF